MNRPARKRYALLALLLAISAEPRLLVAQQPPTVPDAEWAALLDSEPGATLHLTIDGGARLKCRLVSATAESVVVTNIDAGSRPIVTQRDWWQGDRLTLPRSTVRAITFDSPPPSGPKVEAFDELRFIVGSGDRVTITSGSGEHVTGLVTSISPSRISVRTKGMIKEFVDRDVESIRQSRNDSLANGAKWGLAVGVTAGAAAGFLACGTCHAGPGLAAATIVGGLGAGLGAGIGVAADAMTPTRVVLYRSHSSKTKISVAPQLSRSRQAIKLSIGF